MSVTQATFAATLVDEWVRAGVPDAVVCPGSRSTPLALALAARPEVRLHVRLDERGAGFYALGLAMASGRPAVVCTTSGTAAAELHAAVVEAHYGRVPVIVCTADRPPELQRVGAPQTIDQLGLYGGAVRWSAEPGVPAEETRGAWRSLAARAVAEAVAGPAGPGPVHLNLAFREPLVAEPGPLPEGRPDGWPVHRVEVGASAGDPTGASSPASAELVRAWRGRRGVVVAGAGAGPPAAVVALADRLGWPVLADPRSGCRVDHPAVVASVDAFLRSPEVAAALRPEAVLVLGAPWASRVVGEWLAAAGAAGAEVVAVDPWWRWADPDRVVSTVHRADPAAWLAGAVTAAPPAGGPAGDWLARWQSVERAAQQAIDQALGDDGRLTEPALARRLFGVLPEGATVVASSSMPVRDLEWYAPPVARPPRVLANRGANGIDGVCSTALGVAAAGTGPAVALVGDLAFLHDVSALVRPATPGLAAGTCAAEPRTGAAGGGCTLVVVDNRGGGIFEFLPQARLLPGDRFERLFGTPMAADVAQVASGFGWRVAEADGMAALGAALADGTEVVRVRVPDRRENVTVHDRVHRAVAGAAADAL